MGVCSWNVVGQVRLYARRVVRSAPLSRGQPGVASTRWGLITTFNQARVVMNYGASATLGSVKSWQIRNLRSSFGRCYSD